MILWQADKLKSTGVRIYLTPVGDKGYYNSKRKVWKFKIQK